MTNPAPRAVVSEAEIEELRKLAEAACPGPWRADLDAGVFVGREHEVACVPSYGFDAVSVSALRGSRNDDPAPTAAFIAALNPATVLRILTDREAAEARIRALETALRPFAEALTDLDVERISQWDSVEGARFSANPLVTDYLRRTRLSLNRQALQMNDYIVISVTKRGNRAVTFVTKWKITETLKWLRLVYPQQRHTGYRLAQFRELHA